MRRQRSHMSEIGLSQIGETPQSAVASHSPATCTCAPSKKPANTSSTRRTKPLPHLSPPNGPAKAVAPYRPSPRCDELEAVLIYSMSVSVDGFIADREGAFGWSVPNGEQFRFHL